MSFQSGESFVADRGLGLASYNLARGGVQIDLPERELDFLV